MEAHTGPLAVLQVILYKRNIQGDLESASTVFECRAADIVRAIEKAEQTFPRCLVQAVIRL
ncbi:hypothetical protein LUCX_221 [Xanthomonas phage vB_XciM_LucasX]|nr:hypothetical protein LUCX_221 [Xanthomonas phage vB_XciM_LucasX]